MKNAEQVKENAVFQKKHWISITGLCNNNCIFCLDSHRRDKSHKQLKNIFEEIEHARKLGNTKLIISGGEPTIHPNFIDVVKKAKALGFTKIQTISNGRMFSNLGFLKKAVSSGLSEITFSIHGHTEKLHDLFTRVPGSFRQVLRALNNVKQFPNLIINTDTVISRLNFKYLKDIFFFLYRKGIREMNLMSLTFSSNAYDNRSILSYDFKEATPFVKEVIDLAEKHDVVFWLSRYPPEYLEGYERYVEDPHKMVDEVRGMWKNTFANSSRPHCQGTRCSNCGIRLICPTILETKRQMLDSYKKLRKNTTEEILLCDAFKKPEYSSSDAKTKNINLQISKIKKNFGVDISKLELEKDKEYLNKTKKLIEGLPPKQLGILIIVGTSRRVFLEEIISFFNSVKVKYVDLYVDEQKKNQFDLPMGKINQVSKEEVLSKNYDYIISFGALHVLDEVPLKGRPMSILLNDFTYISQNNGNLNWLMSYDDNSVKCYNMFRHALPGASFGKFAAKMDMRYSIDWAPDNAIDYKIPKKHLFDYVFFGGRERDYRLLYDNRKAFEGKRIILTKSDALIPRRQKKYLDMLRKHDNFVCIDQIPHGLFLKLLLYSKISIAFFEGNDDQDYTSLSEAMWYGKPIITNKVKANKHLSKFLLFANNSDEISHHLKQLEDKDFYNTISEKTVAFARGDNSLFTLLLHLYNDLEVDAKKSKEVKPREIYENKIIITKDLIGLTDNKISYFLKEGNEYEVELQEPTAKLSLYSELTPKLKDVKQFITRLSRLTKSKNIKLYFKGIPSCILPDSLKKKENILRLETPRMHIPFDGNIDYVSLARRLSKSVRIKPLSCKSCVFTNRCPGIYLQYFRLFGSEEIKPAYFKEVRINLECNQRCLFCNTDKDAENVVLDTDSVINKLVEWRKKNVLLLTVSGKEPTLNKNLPHIISKAKKLGYLNVNLQTNAILLKDIEFVKCLVRKGLDSAFVSIHAHNDELSTRITGLKGSLKDTVAGIKNLINEGVAVTINIVINSINYKHLKNIVSFIYSSFTTKGTLKIRGIVFSFVSPVCSAWKNKEIIPKFSDVKPFLEKAISFCEAKRISFNLPGRCSVPLCFLGENMIYSAEYYEPEMWVDERDKTKIKQCTNCVLHNMCSGLWNNYISLYGTGEIKPVDELPKEK
ncbi:radical SAM protein [Candidatus Woesearchaeota archaeon]|nr:radical SAM protein [Candidatus Woesearchaeota archaeon]